MLYLDPIQFLLIENKPSDENWKTILLNSATHLKGTSTRNKGTIIKGILDGSQAIPNRILSLNKCVFVWSLNENCHTMGILQFLHKGVLSLSLEDWEGKINTWKSNVENVVAEPYLPQYDTKLS